MVEKEHTKRFWSKVNIDGPTMQGMTTQCWVWTASTWRFGYGRFSVKGVSTPAHRVSFGLDNIPEGMSVLHRCDNRLCVRRSHLFLGTIADNNADTRKKRRHSHGRKHGDLMRGEKSCRAVLSEEDVKSMKEEYAKEGVSQKELAEKYGVHRSTISRAINGNRWSHLRNT